MHVHVHVHLYRRLVRCTLTKYPLPISLVWQSTLAAKQVELDDCKKRMVFLEEQLRVAQRQTDRATLVKLKKVGLVNFFTVLYVKVSVYM